MPISVFDLFSVGIGPSSSHTMGPMRAASSFAHKLKEAGLLSHIAEIEINLYGSLALTGKGHATDIAILLGLEGESPEGIDPDTVPDRIQAIHNNNSLALLKEKTVPFQEEKHLLFHKDKFLPIHPNGMRFTAFDEKKREAASQVYYSIGGGFIIEHGASSATGPGVENYNVPYPFHTGNGLLALCSNLKKSIADLIMENEKTRRNEKAIREGLLNIWKIMQESVKRGCSKGGILPGGLNVKRRAEGLYKSLQAQKEKGKHDPVEVLKWVSLWALAVNEENAAGGRVITAPTNGAAGVIPAVLHYYALMTENPSEEGIITFLLTAGAIGTLYKFGASISAAEMGCMGEVGVACSMAAAGLTAALGGTNKQVESAAEIGMEHNLGLTCDPVMGLVQVPCIERNTMGAVKAINACLLALEGTGEQMVTLDQVIATMKQTGHDMQSIYKETSLGGLAVNVPEC